MGTLATSLAHELNQPLTAIANYVETANYLLEKPDVETIATVREALAECAAQSVRAGQIVRRLRDFISRGETERRIESLQRLVTESSALALVGAGDLNLEVDVRLDSTADEVLVDRIQIQQVVLNLMRNAIEAMAESPIRRLLITSERKSDGFVYVTVADSGPGLPEDVAQHLAWGWVCQSPRRSSRRTADASGPSHRNSAARRFISPSSMRIVRRPRRE
jgi:two-component system sensor kinase FixL